MLLFLSRYRLNFQDTRAKGYIINYSVIVVAAISEELIAL
jgi:hypothetical protein